MYILGIETATSVISVALMDDDRLVVEYLINNPKTHSVNLMPLIKNALTEADATPEQLEAIAVSLGPGSFTGLRIGISTAKTLAQVWGLPVVGVNTLEALAYPFTGLKGYLCPVLNARKNEVYAAVYETGDNILTCRLGPLALTPLELATKLRTIGQSLALLGEGVLIYHHIWQEYLTGKVIYLPAIAYFPRGAAIAALGRKILQANGGIDPVQLKPYYLRLSEAEIKWFKGQLSGEKK